MRKRKPGKREGGKILTPSWSVFDCAMVLDCETLAKVPSAVKASTRTSLSMRDKGNMADT